MRILVFLSVVGLGACGGGTSMPEHSVEMGPVPDFEFDDLGTDLPDVGPDLGSICATGYGPVTEVGHLAHGALIEQSGLVASRTHPQTLWTHNDSGDGAWIYALGTDGADLGRFMLSGIDAYDFEDIAAARCPQGDGQCLWIADIGDNARRRDEVVIYVVEEPVPTPGEGEISVGWQFHFQYEGGPRDAEALLVAPAGDRLWIIDKVEGTPTGVFVADTLQDKMLAELRRQTEFDAPGVPIAMGQLVTGADLHPSGRRMVLRVYTGIYEFELPAPEDFDTIAAIEPTRVTLGPLAEKQGEAVAYSASGRDIYSVSESITGEPGEALHIYSCQEDTP